MITIHRLPRYLQLYPFFGLLSAAAQAFAVIPACQHSIYCTGDLLHRIQIQRIFPDSKTFVDMKLIRSQNETLDDYAKLLKETNNKPTRDQLIKFTQDHFEEGNELESWKPPDFNPEPPVLKDIKDERLRLFAKNVIEIWSKLGRKSSQEVIDEPDHFSFINVPNGFIVPGGRFKEIYYWDTYWIVRGLLISNMTETAKGMIENLLYIVNEFGYIPNGNRIYYLGRSQPPLLTEMVAKYFEATNDISWLEKNIPIVEKELQYWLENKKVAVNIKGSKYVLLRYYADRSEKGPRPESYYEDYTNARILKTEKEREDFYLEMKSAAESGWDFSSRWFVTAADVIGNLTNVHATRILPVDLNSIFAGALETAGDLRSHLKHRREAQKWWSLAKYWRSAIENVLWDSSDGVWYDYDAEAQSLRRHFYPSCATPLWSGAVEASKTLMYAESFVKYLLSSGALNFPGGIPTSIYHSGEQWDFPNAWPPLQSILIGGLDSSGYEAAKTLARDQARIWIRANYIGYSTWKKMFEKYSAVDPGRQGGGGEYGVQDGFGWTNGVLLELLQRYGKDFILEDDPSPNEPFVQQLV